MSKSTWPKIRQRIQTVKSKKYPSWIVDCGVVDGKRVAKTFKTKKEAETHAQKMRIARRKIGHDAMRLSDDQVRQAVEAFQILDGKGSIKEAAEFYAKHAVAEDMKITVSALCEIFLQKKESTGKREKTILDYRARINNLAKTYGDTLVSEITTSMLEEWLDKKKYGGVSRQNYKRIFTVFFNFAVNHNHTHYNPAKGLESVRIDERTPGVLTIPQIKNLLSVCQDEDDDYVPYFALAVFAGIRPEEILRLDWSRINFDKQIVMIDGAISKTRRNRTVEMTDNLKAWLFPLRKKEGPVVPSGKHFWTRSKQIRANAGVKDIWENDMLRHTFGTYHYAFHEDEGKTVKQMGNSSYVFQKHYNDGLVSKSDAEEFWAITPDAKSNTVKFAAAG